MVESGSSVENSVNRDSKDFNINEEKLKIEKF